MAEGISIVLADDHTVVRRGLRMLLEDEPGFEVVAEAEDAEGAVRYVRGHKPDVLLLDLNMPGKPSLEAIPEIQEVSPETKIVVLTMQREPAFARQALQLGVLVFEVLVLHARLLFHQIDHVGSDKRNSGIRDNYLAALLEHRPPTPACPVGRNQ